MAAKVYGDAALGTILFALQWVWYRALCMYCVMTSALSLAAAALAIPETRAALRRIRNSRHCD